MVIKTLKFLLALYMLFKNFALPIAPFCKWKFRVQSDKMTRNQLVTAKFCIKRLQCNVGICCTISWYKKFEKHWSRRINIIKLCCHNKIWEMLGVKFVTTGEA